MVNHLSQNGYMSKQKNNSPYELEYKAFAKFIRGENIPLESLVVLILKSFVAIFEMTIRYIPGGIGYTLRYWYYKCTLKHLGKNVLYRCWCISLWPKKYLDWGIYMDRFRSPYRGYAR